MQQSALKKIPQNQFYTQIEATIKVDQQDTGETNTAEVNSVDFMLTLPKIRALEIERPLELKETQVRNTHPSCPKGMESFTAPDSQVHCCRNRT